MLFNTVITFWKKRQGLDLNQRLPRLRRSTVTMLLRPEEEYLPLDKGRRWRFTELPWRMTVSWIQTSISKLVDNRHAPARIWFYPVKFLRDVSGGLVV